MLDDHVFDITLMYINGENMRILYPELFKDDYEMLDDVGC